MPSLPAIDLVSPHPTIVRTLRPWEAFLRPAVRVVVSVQQSQLLADTEPGLLLPGLVHHLVAGISEEIITQCQTGDYCCRYLWLVCVGFLLYLEVSQRTILLLPSLAWRDIESLNKLISPEWVPVESYWVKVNIRIVPFSKVGAAPVKTPDRQL